MNPKSPIPDAAYPKLANNIDPDTIVDQLYDIALDPNSLHLFIDAWNGAGLDAQAARKAIETIDDFDAAYHAHLKRAQTFLDRGDGDDAGPDLAALLAPFEDLAAFIVDRNSQVVASNMGAQHALSMADGIELADIDLAPDMKVALDGVLSQIFSGGDQPDRLLHVPGKKGAALFQIRPLANIATTRPQYALVVTTLYHWQAALGQTLEEVFKLTSAEQGVVKSLVEGMDAKSISAERGTSEGTVRGQIKSILSKMNARSQSEVIRLVLSLRDVSQGTPGTAVPQNEPAQSLSYDWTHDEVWKPFKSIVLPDGRKMDYHDMGPKNGAPILFTHMGYCAVRWHGPMIKLAFQYGLRVIVPIRAGYGHSENIHPRADVLASTREDTSALLDYLEIEKLPYVSQGNDLIFSVDYASRFSQRITELIGICARPPLLGDKHYAGMSKWHRFFLSTAKHAPHLLNFTTRAAVAMAKRMGPIEFFRQANQSSPADLALLQDPELLPVLVANGALVVSKTTNMSRAYVMETLACEIDWTNLVVAAGNTPTWFVNGGEDPAMDIATISEYREAFPWIDIEVIPNAGQMLIYQHFDKVIPRLAAAAKRAQK